MARYYIGTAGWSYKDWEGIVYPKKKGPGFHALIFLARFINFIEINSTFYRFPVKQYAQSWIKKVEPFPDFKFAVKLHQNFTHKRGAYSEQEVTQFKSGIEPLLAFNRLAAILMQFPWSFAYSAENLAYLTGLFQAFTSFPLALELRHSSWLKQANLRLMHEHEVIFCNIDQPLFKNSLEPTALATSKQAAYVRLHGRNYKTWFKQNAGRDARYNYLYSNEELDDWIGRIKELERKSDNIYIVTNNHYQGQALTNALQIKNKLSGEKLAIPLELVQQYPELKNILKKIDKGQQDLFDGSTEIKKDKPS